MSAMIKKLKDLRTAKDWTQADLAKQLGVSCKTISNWEQGVCRVSGSAQILIDKLLNDR